jgi:hypothetical protein
MAPLRILNMPRLTALLLAIALAGLAAGDALAQAPSSKEARAIWEAFWTRVRAGDMRGAYRYVHPSRLPYVLQQPSDQLQEMARQMQYCRLRPDPLPSVEDVLFEVHCEHDGETADTLVGFREDSDGAWRLTLI